MENISNKAARRIVLAAQGFGEPELDGDVTRRHLKKAIARLGLFQIDSVNVIVRAHYMPMFSRLGPYPRVLIDDAAVGRKRLLFEYWAHEASLLPVETYPLMRWRMERAAQGDRIYTGLAKFGREQASFIEDVFEELRRRGPVAASDFENEKGAGGWWGWSHTKTALEFLFWSGRITTAERRPSFERLYDLPERVLPKDVLAIPTPEPAEAKRQLLKIAARSLGVATAGDLRDYFRMAPDDTYPHVQELIEAGELVPVRVKGWADEAYIAPNVRRPRKITARALLAPFDPLIWRRPRTERLFDFHYRIEIYTPAEKRQFGYYVLPFLVDEALVGRVCLKADRQVGTLRVNAAWHENHALPGPTAEALLAALKSMAGWLNLAAVSLEAHGNLAPALRVAAGADTVAL
ncbi:winged helix-turn-helix domain-containing protein [Mesorhizobium sp. NBSH29]|uniref:winged helix-turn-helix domain-containing protein n=1 Tax=Mesorhizobium sp. NBSH29 TaxID=2654249 RepID=UPI001896657B|nr:winged helix-turn-helix domain-containing protein [Mesorhizobium sp. NBSH29]QPC88129.1 winged helix-turn-helix domain-containing protein [Mesorhizobium sp. NBSH29]